MAGKFTTKN